MKATFYSLLLIILLSSCGKGGVQVESSKIKGPLGDYFEVVERDYEVKDGKVSIEFKRIKSGFPEPWNENMQIGNSENCFEPLFTAEFKDEKGNTLSKDKTDITLDIDELKELAALDVDETSTIKYNAPEEASLVKISSTFEAHAVILTTLSGNIGTMPICMSLKILPDGKVLGAYYYKKYEQQYFNGQLSFLYLTGERNGNHITIKEYSREGLKNGTYSGELHDDGTFTGTFSANSGDYQFRLVPDSEARSVDFSGIDIDALASMSSDIEDSGTFDLNNVLLPSQLRGKVKVISAEKSVGSFGYPTMEITFKLLSRVNTSSLCSEYGQMWIVGVGQNENGVDVKELLPNYREWRSGDSDGDEFKSFLESEPGETITLEFTGDKEYSNDVEKDLEKVKKFKLKISND